MAIKTTIGSKGVVSERIAGTQDELVFDTNKKISKFTATGPDVAGVVAIENPFTLIRPGAGGEVTGSLPSLGGEDSLRLLVLKDDTDGMLILSGTNPVVHGATAVDDATFELRTDVPNAAFDLVSSVSGSTYYWCAVVGSGSY